MDELQEASTDFEIEKLQLFLERVSVLVPAGFGKAEVTSIISLARSMEVDDEKSVDFSIEYAGKAVILKVELFMDDIDLVDVAFFAPPALADRIMEEIDDFYEGEDE